MRPRKLEVVDIAAIAWLLAFGMLQVCLGWRVADLGVPASVIEEIFTTIIFSAMILMFYAYFILPDSHVAVRSASISYSIPASLKNQQWGTLRNVRERTRAVSRDGANRKTFFIRLGVVTGIIAITGILAFTPLIF
jgi:hypothetical protein